MMDKFTGLEYLKIDIANNFGLDKEDWDYRLTWFNLNESTLMNMIKQAEKPAMFYAGIKAYHAAKSGTPSGYPISLDATSSGIQILAALTGDRKAAEHCNLVDTGHRKDAYTNLYEAMCGKIGEASKIDRKDTKQAIMTAFYGSTALPKIIFGEGRLLDMFHETMKEEAPGAWELNQTMLDIWNPNVLINEWVMPDNFHVKIKVMSTVTEKVNFLNEPFDVNYSLNMPMEKGRSLCANMTHSTDGMIVREITSRCDYDIDQIDYIKNLLQRGAKGGKSLDTIGDKLVHTLSEHHRESGFLSARCLARITVNNMGHINRDALIDMIQNLPENPFKILSVHDCFRCLPNYGNDLRQQYNNILSEIAESNLLSFIVSQIVKRKVSVNKLDNTLHRDIRNANYALS